MTRAFCILTGTILALASVLAFWNGRGAEPDRICLTLALGGDPTKYAPTFRCDGGLDGNGGGTGYVKCTAAGASCSQCVTQAPDGSISGTLFYGIKSLGFSRGNGVMYNQLQPPPTQPCGNTFTGTCVVNSDPNSSGFTCVGTQGTACPTQPTIVDQPFGS